MCVIIITIPCARSGNACARASVTRARRANVPFDRPDREATRKDRGSAIRARVSLFESMMAFTGSRLWADTEDSPSSVGQRYVMSNFVSYLLYTGGVRRSRRRRRAESSFVHSFVRSLVRSSASGRRGWWCGDVRALGGVFRPVDGGGTAGEAAAAAGGGGRARGERAERDEERRRRTTSRAVSSLFSFSFFSSAFFVAPWSTCRTRRSLFPALAGGTRERLGRRRRRPPPVERAF